MRAAASEDRPSVVGFDQVYEAERMAVVRLAFLLVRSQALAEELAHDAFLRLYERFGSVDNPAGFLRTVVVRLSITAQNRARMERDRLTVVGAGAPSGGGEPEIDETWAALGRLRPERRTVLVLRFYADMPFGDIAAAVGCTSATARGRARRALADLRRELLR